MNKCPDMKKKKKKNEVSASSSIAMEGDLGISDDVLMVVVSQVSN